MTSSVAHIHQERQFINKNPENFMNDDASQSESDEDSDSEDEDERKKESTVSVRHLLNEVLIAIKEGKLDLRKKDQLDKFCNNQGPRLARKTKDGKQPTALHILVAKDTAELPSNDQLEPLIRFLVKRPENFLAVRDLAGYTPLYFAIAEKKDKIAEYMCQAHETIDSILSIQSHEGKNCLHLAITQRTKLTSFLVGEAEAYTLCAKDKDGNTPLHLAVEYKRCRKEQLPIIKAIVAKCDSVMRISKDGVFNKASLSPYCHHIETSRKAEKQKKEKDAEKKRIGEGKEREKGSGRSRPDNDRRITKDRVEKVKSEPPKVPVMSPILHQEKNPENTFARRGNWQVDHTLGRDALLGNNSASDNYGAEQLKAATNISPTVGTAPDFPALNIGDKEKATLKKDLTKKKVVSRVTEDTIRPIKHFLKLHYLRERGHDAALEILYGRNTTSDQQIYFDLSGYNNLTEGQVKTTLSFLNFEEILQYVEIPQLRIDVSSNAANIKRARGRIPKPDGMGRSDLLCVFNGLREKKVNTILKVIVDDLAHPSHSDEAIEKALDKMGVEVWDWKKIDLCIEVILKAAPNVREVHLYWSGNNALLRGWSEEGGLKRLKELAKVHLHVQQGLESLARTQQNVAEFRIRMEKLYNRDIVVVDEGLEVLRETIDINTARGDADHPESSTKHEWVECMKEFRQLLFNAENYQEKESGKKIEKIEEPIKVALIDDGINFDKLEYNPIGGRSFCTRDTDQNLNFPYYKSSTGHGSIMASQIYRICPRTQLYVLKLEDHMSKSSTRQITAKSAAQAIRAAVRRKVHIISMSWTIDPPEDENDKRDLESAILEAAKDDILMFCSAKDKGAKQTSSYPSLATNKIFKIGAAEASGAPDAWVGDLTRIDFTFPGNQVELEGFSNEINKEVVSGSSVATALAAGLAALVLYCVQVRVQYTKGREQENARRDFQALKKHDQMMKAFKNIGTTEESKNKYIAVWELFGKLVRDSERCDKPEWIDLIVKAGAELCVKL